jgi:formylglycine-generating enzyme required for sulfatase activity
MFCYIRSLIVLCIFLVLLPLLAGCGSSSSGQRDSHNNNKHPEVSIIAPLNNSVYTYEDIVSFVGEGTDLEGVVLPESAFTWESSIDGLIETSSKEFSTDFLSIGTHTITLTVTDSYGATNTAMVNVMVLAAMPDGDFTNFIGMTFNDIEPGTFMMGSPADEDGRFGGETQHEVTLTQGYRMQTTQVTQGQWEAVMGNKPSFFSNCGSDCPVEQVSWHDAQAFITALNALEGTTRYALPTEAQWEYAARAESTTAFANGEITHTGSGNDPVLDSMGWYIYNSEVDYAGCWDLSLSGGSSCAGTHPFAQKAPNAWGLYDMHGNVWEWVADWHDMYPDIAVTDPTGPSSGTNRVFRGGSWNYDASYCRSAFRDGRDPEYNRRNHGFRVVLLPDH